MMKVLPMKTLVVSHATVVMSWLAVTLELARVIEAGMVIMLCVIEVSASYAYIVGQFVWKIL